MRQYWPRPQRQGRWVRRWLWSAAEARAYVAGSELARLLAATPARKAIRPKVNAVQRRYRWQARNVARLHEKRLLA